MVRRKLHVSERRACKVIGQIRSTQRYLPVVNPDQEKLEKRVIELATEYGRYGYRKVTDLLNMEGFPVGKDRVYSIWRREGLKVHLTDLGQPMALYPYRSAADHSSRA